VSQIEEKLKIAWIAKKKKFLIVKQEITKMLMNQSSLKHLDHLFNDDFNDGDLPFITYPGASNCSRRLSRLLFIFKYLKFR